MASPHTVHEWRERAEDGEHRYFRAWRGLGQWHFLTTLRSEPDWHPVAEPDRAFLEELREKIHAKYQRRRVPWEHLEEVDKMLAALPPADAADSPGADDEADDEN